MGSLPKDGGDVDPGTTLSASMSWPTTGTKTIWARAVDSKGAESEWESDEVTVDAPPPPPPPPTNIQVDPGCSGIQPYVTVKWTASPGATKYYIYRDSSEIGSTNGVLTYRDSTVANSSPYSYSVRAEGPTGTSGSSVSVPVTSLNCVPPLSPTADLKVNNSDGPITITYNSTARVTWCGAPGTPCANATRCSVTYRGVGGTRWMGNSVTPRTSGDESQNLTVARTYTLRCTGSGPPATDEVTVNVGPKPECDTGDARYCGTPNACGDKGLERCFNGAWSGVCIPVSVPNEICNNGTDDDCDGVMDNSCIPPPTTFTCGNGRCERSLGENFVNCPADCPQKIIEVKAPKPSFLAWVGNFFASWFSR
jgi:hypothetical protein